MIRAGELLAFLAPLVAVLLWGLAVRRGLDGPPPRQLAWIAAGLIGLAAALGTFSLEDRLAPGRYVPAHMADGVIVPGHVEAGQAGTGDVETRHVVPGPAGPGIGPGTGPGR